MAITRSQQAKQMLQDGGMLVKPSMDGKRPGYRGDDAERAREARSREAKSSPKSTGSPFSNQGSGDDNRQTYSAIQTQTGKVKGGGDPIIGSGGEIIGFEDARPSKTAIDNARKFQEEQRQKREEAIKRNRTFNPFPLMTSAFDKISNSRLAKLNNAFQRNNYLRTLSPSQISEILEKLAEEEGIGTTNPMGIDRNIQRGLGEYDYIDEISLGENNNIIETTSPNRGFLNTGIGAGKFITDIEFGGEGAKNVINEVTDGGYDAYLKRNEITDTGGDNASNQDPCLGPNPPAYCNVNQDPTDPTPTRNLAGLTPRIGGSIFNFDEFAADGGRIGAMDGGIMSVDDLDREAFLLGGIAKGIKKAVRGVKKLAKSPIGKAAILGAVGFGFGSKEALGSFFGKGSFNPFLRKVAGDTAFSGLGSILSKAGLVSKAGLPTFKGGIALASILPLLAGKQDDEFDIDAYYASQKLEPATTARQAGSEFDFYNYNLAEGGTPRKEPVAKKVMPLLDMGGMEKDYRAEGGFVPIGRMEKADDVPARLSKNEFVFTADAVRNAGDGDVDKGAEVMYNMMKNLEAGGEVSEESQGLDGAREMFQTSQRLGEVI